MLRLGRRSRFVYGPVLSASISRRMKKSAHAEKKLMISSTAKDALKRNLNWTHPSVNRDLNRFFSLRSLQC